MVQGLIDTVRALQGTSSATETALKEYIKAQFPFIEVVKETDQGKLREVMEKEMAKGVLKFSPVTTNPIAEAAKRFSLPNDVLQRLKDKKGTR